ncbi:hypothetical protein EV2_009040 [Malus domestica]
MYPKKKKGEAFTKVAHVTPQYLAKFQEEEAPEVDYSEPQYLVELQITKAENAYGVQPQTSDGHFESDIRSPTADQAFSSCS